MNLIINLDERELIDIIERQVRSMVRYTDYHASELSQLLVHRTKNAVKEAIMAFDVEAVVRATLAEQIQHVTDDVVRAAVEKEVKAALKAIRQQEQSQ